MHFLLFFLLLAPATLLAQTPKFALLDAKDPLIGEWEWIRTDTGSPAAPFPDQDWIYLRFSAGTAQSMGALSFDDDKGYGCPSYFLAFSDGKNITATLSDSCIPGDKGKKFSFAYSCTGDELILTVRGQHYYYKRRTA